MKLSLYFVLFAFLVSCSSTDEFDTKTAEGAFKAAEKLEKDELFEMAIKKYSEVKNRHPYSRFAVESELRIADIHFKRENYAEARAAYQVFKDLHPTHKKSDYVTNQLALSYYHQLPSTIDRDLSLALKAIQYFDEVMRTHPNSKYAKKAKKYRADLRTKLAEKELYIANFYMKKDMYLAAHQRFAGVVDSYSDVEDLIPKALLGAGKSAAENGDKPTAKQFLDKLIKNYANSEQADQAKEAAREYGL
ncbi:MAG: outer membrane protein assembly factor BamD [Bdellovibrionales bacterium]|nr:outer membrane protein assembly factor BamD [Bdellovibrionales bacterium]